MVVPLARPRARRRVRVASMAWADMIRRMRGLRSPLPGYLFAAFAVALATVVRVSVII